MVPFQTEEASRLAEEPTTLSPGRREDGLPKTGRARGSFSPLPTAGEAGRASAWPGEGTQTPLWHAEHWKVPSADESMG